jgi:hypothetical protein
VAGIDKKKSSENPLDKNEKILYTYKVENNNEDNNTIYLWT